MKAEFYFDRAPEDVLSPERERALFENLAGASPSLRFEGVRDAIDPSEELCTRRSAGERYFYFSEGDYDYSLSFFRSGTGLQLASSTAFVDPVRSDQSATLLLDCFARVIPALAPSFAYLDMLGFNALPPESVEQTELSTLYWANVFGPAYVAKFGREFLLAAPVWQAVEVASDTILCVLTESYSAAAEPANVAAALEYFRTVAPGLQRYEAESGPP